MTRIPIHQVSEAVEVRVQRERSLDEITAALLMQSALARLTPEVRQHYRRWN